MTPEEQEAIYDVVDYDRAHERQEMAKEAGFDVIDRMRHSAAAARIRQALEIRSYLITGNDFRARACMDEYGMTEDQVTQILERGVT